MEKIFKCILLLISGFCVLCLFLHVIILTEELNIKQLQRESLELVKQQLVEKLEYYQLLNKIYSK